MISSRLRLKVKAAEVPYEHAQLLTPSRASSSCSPSRWTPPHNSNPAEPLGPHRVSSKSGFFGIATRRRSTMSATDTTCLALGSSLWAKHVASEGLTVYTLETVSQSP